MTASPSAWPKAMTLLTLMIAGEMEAAADFVVEDLDETTARQAALWLAMFAEASLSALAVALDDGNTAESLAQSMALSIASAE